MRASIFATDIRLMYLRPTIWSVSGKADPVKDINPSSFRSMIRTLLSEVFVKALYAGNVDESGAKVLKETIEGILLVSKSCVMLECNFPLNLVTTVPLATECKPIIVPTRYPKETNTEVQVYFQVGQYEIPNRVLIYFSISDHAGSTL